MNIEFNKNEDAIKLKIAEMKRRLSIISLGGGKKKIEKEHSKGKLTARERIEYIIDPKSTFLEIGAFVANDMYQEYGGCPAAGVVMGIGYVSKKQCIIVANDATVKAGAWFPITAKKNLRAQEIAMENKLPIIYLVDSAGVFLPLQDEIFPDKEHFGRIFRNNARMSSMGITQISAVMGSCVAGGAYLPIMSDDSLIVDKTGSIFLAGSYLVKAAIGENIDNETLGGATTHCDISGVTDYKAKDDKDCLNRIRNIMGKLGDGEVAGFNRTEAQEPKENPQEIYGILPEKRDKPYKVRDLITRLVDKSEFDEYKAGYGQSIICGLARVEGWAVGIVANERLVVKSEFDEYKAGYGQSIICGLARVEGWAVGIVANERLVVKSKTGEMQFGGVIYSDSADKAARFIMNCNQKKIPLVFLQDVTGFMVGSRSEHGGIIKDGAKLVNAMANSVVPKFTIITGNSFGAGNYAMCGKAYDPRLIVAWPTAQIAVMGGTQAAKVLLQIEKASLKSKGEEITPEREAELLKTITERYDKQMSPYYAASRLWVDSIIDPLETRKVISMGIEMANNAPIKEPYNVGVLQT